MIYLHLAVIFSLCLLVICRRGLSSAAQKDPEPDIIILLFGGALLLRVLCACSNQGFGTDMGCFSAWAERLRTVGANDFYSETVFTDYPPGFLYYLYIVGMLCGRLGIAAGPGWQYFLIKLPACLADIICGWLLYREAGARLGRRKACFLAAVYLYQPVFILDSALWGQVDSLLTLAVVVMCLMLMKGKLPAAYIAFGLGVLLKPQMLVFAPVIIAGILDQVFLKAFSWRKLAYHLVCGLETIAGMVVLCLPFGLGKVVRQYVTTLGEYPYAAVNACNFWGILGKNWVSQSEKFFFLSYQGWGFLVIAVIVAAALYISLRMREDTGKYPLIAAFVIFTMFLFSVRMHERYMYPGLAMLLLAYLCWPEKGLYLCYGGFSVLSFYNIAWVMYFYDPSDYDRKALFILAVSAGMLLCGGLLYYLLVCCCRGKKPVQVLPDHAEANRNGWADAFQVQDAFRISGTDLILAAIITAFYAGFALTNLGNRQAPATVYEVKQGERVVLEFEKPVASFSYYIAPRHEREFHLDVRSDGAAAWQQGQDFLMDDVFSWQEIVLDKTGSWLCMSPKKDACILELCFRDAEGNPLMPVNAQEYAALFDEQELCPERSSFRDSMYFDEIYHGRTAYEFLHGLYSYENTHPPLGKIFISFGVAIFGMNPFGWRIAGTVFGILMVPAVFLFAKRFTGSTVAAGLAGMLFAFDFMHFVQTRIATIDVYITFFVILMYYFMYQYITGIFRGEAGKYRMVSLGASGVCMGLGVACKWTGVYAGLGLAVIFFACLYWQSRRLKRAVFVRQAARTAGFCLVFFVCIPAVIYLLSYIPFVDSLHDGLLQRMVYNQHTMFDYHSKLESTHSFSSLWYEWPVMTRPIWYYSGDAGGTLREGISAFGNPLVWWVGIPALLYMIWRVAKYRDGKALFLTVSYMAQYLPWMFITRLTFIYHFFPSVVFVVLMIVYSLQFAAGWAGRVFPSRAKHLFPVCAAVYALAAFGLFLLFYPVLSGAPVEVEFVKNWLRWMRGWVLIAG